MMRTLSMKLVLVTLFVISGCVTQQTYDHKVGELENCQQDLASCRKKARADLQACTEARAGTESYALECLKEARTARARAEQLQQRETELRARLKTEIAAKNVEIEQLMDKLSVRVLDRILFLSGSADILSDGRAVLDKLAEVIKDSNETIRVEGHTDNVPIHPNLKPKYFSNWELSGARAASVVRYFQHHHNIDPLRMEGVGLSEYRPVATNDTEEGRLRNRRVELQLAAPR